MWFEDEADDGKLMVDDEVVSARAAYKKQCQVASEAAALPLDARCEKAQAQQGVGAAANAPTFAGSAYAAIKAHKQAGESETKRNPADDMPDDFIAEEEEAPPPPKFVPEAEGDTSQLPPEMLPGGQQAKYVPCLALRALWCWR